MGAGGSKRSGEVGGNAGGMPKRTLRMITRVPAANNFGKVGTMEGR